MKEVQEDSFDRLIEPSLEREIRSDLTEKAEEKAIANNSLDSIAITSNNEIYTYTEKGIVKKPLSQYKNDGSEQALTVNDLIYLRKESPEFSFKNDVSTIIAETAGLD